MILLLLLSGLAGIFFSIYQHRAETEPAYVEPERTFHYPMSFLKHIKGRSNQGELIYKAYCSSCHDPNPRIPLPAPRVGDRSAWAPYQSMDLNALVKLAAHGNGAMPARGGCFECDDLYLKKAIAYILERNR